MIKEQEFICFATLCNFDSDLLAASWARLVMTNRLDEEQVEFQLTKLDLTTALENTHWANTIHPSFRKSKKSTGEIKTERIAENTDININLDALQNLTLHYCANPSP